MGAERQEGERDPDIFRPRFEAAFDAHHADVLAFACRRVDDRAAAEDVVSETFAVVWRRRDAIPEPSLPWIYGIARRVIANQRRSEKRRLRLRERLYAESDAEARGRDPAQILDRRDAVVAAFWRLSESDREVLRLVAWDQVDTRSAARILDCTPGAFRVRLHRARRELEQQLEAGHPTPGPEQIASPPITSAEETR